MLGLFGLLLVMVVAIPLVFASEATPESASKISPKTYGEFVSEFNNITVENLKVKQSNKNDEFLLYVGRGTCPYCSAFVPKLYEAAIGTEEIYYLDTENKTQSLVDYLTEFEIEFVPYFVKFKGQNVIEVLDITDNISVSDIQNFINH